jgi:DNA-binding response OmpR family regulator
LKLFRVLVVEDDERILNFVKSKLKAVGYGVLTARNGAEALQKAGDEEPDMIVLDLVMPEMDGLQMLEKLRCFSSVPVIILSAKGTDQDKIKGLGLGADDYLPKPFNPEELVARVEAVRRRFKPAEERLKPERRTFGDIEIDFKKRTVTSKGEEKYLTRIEWLLLKELALNAGRLMYYEELLARVWGPEYRDDIQLLRTWISRLRYKLESTPGDPGLIRTVPKAGYIVGQPTEG